MSVQVGRSRIHFSLQGQVTRLEKAAVAPNAIGYRPSRPLGGWLAVYATLGPNSEIVEAEDRQGHVFEAARTLGQIDFSTYLARGKWNDTHHDKGQPKHVKTWVGVPRALEHHDGTTELSKAHRKIGWWTEGHLFDRDDPQSWALFTDYEPTPKDLAKADYYWTLSEMLKGLPRTLGFSAEGDMILSPCGGRIVWAQVKNNAVCELPQSPPATAQPLELAVEGGLDPEVVRSLNVHMLGRSPCDSCRCPPGARCPTLPTLGRVQELALATRPPETGTPADPMPHETVDPTDEQPDAQSAQFDRFCELLSEYHHVSLSTARRWAAQFRRSVAEESACS